MKVVSLLLALASAFGLAADNSAASPAISNRQSSIVNGVDAITIPQMLSYQGKLTDTFGLPVADTLYAVRFRLYAQPTGGTHFWEESQNVRTTGGLFSIFLGSVTPIGSVPDAGAAYLGMAVAGGAELTPRLRIASAAYAYLSARAANADLLQGRDTTTFSRSTHNHDATYVNEAQANSVTGAMLVDGTVKTADVGDTAVTMAKLAKAGATTGEVIKWTGSVWEPGPDNTGGGSGVTNVYQDTGITCVPNPITTTGNVKLNLSYSDARYVNEAQANSVTGAMITDGQVSSADIRDTTVNTADFKDAAVTAPKLNQMGAASGQVLKWTGSAWAPRNDSVGGGGGDNAWVRGTPDSVLFTIRPLGLARGGASNMLHGAYRYNHVNFGSSCTTGTNGSDFTNCTVGGGVANRATGPAATVSGGSSNVASGSFASITGGELNCASHVWATVPGGTRNLAGGVGATVAGGAYDSAIGYYSSVGGGCYNTAGFAATDTAAAVAGGRLNRAAGMYSFVGGGHSNTAPGMYATVAGGSADSARGAYSGALSGLHNAAGDLATDTASVIAGGWDNDITGRYSTIGGGHRNGILSNRATIAGGDSNTLEGGTCGAIGGGRRNSVDNAFSTVAGGYSNSIDGQYSAIGGGLDNHVDGKYCVVAGGDSNTTSASYHTVVSGGSNNYIDESATYSAVGGGRADSVRAMYGAVGGGYSNKTGDAADDTATVIAGGWNNAATGKFNFIGGGYQNTSSNNYSVIGGGRGNTANGPQASVLGGWGNTASGWHSAIGGGLDNVASGTSSVVSGGEDNLAGGTGATAGGGKNDTCNGDYALVSGYNVRARANADYSLAFGENCSTSVPRAVVFYHSGAATKMGVGVQTPTHNIDVQGGAYCNGTNWVNGSSRKLKTDISVLTPEQMEDVVEELERTQVVTYRYKSEPNGEQHIGLIAEDAPELMATPDRDGINTADAIGFLLALAKAQQAEIEALKVELRRR